MTIPPDQDHLGDDGSGPYRRLEAIEQDLERLGELTGPHVTDAREDLSAAAARIPDAGRRREAEELLERLRPAIEPHLDAIEQAGPGLAGLLPLDDGLPALDNGLPALEVFGLAGPAPSGASYWPSLPRLIRPRA